MLRLDELKAAIVMMKRAPLKGEESLIVAQTILKLERMAQALLQPPTPTGVKSDDTGTSE